MMAKNAVLGVVMAVLVASPTRGHDGHDLDRIAVEVQGRGAAELLLEVTNNGAQPVVIMGRGCAALPRRR